MTKVIHIKDVPPGWKSNPDYVYIGRPGKGLDGPWGNPFVLPPGAARGQTLEQYEQYLNVRLETEPDFVKEVAALKGKFLVCFCAPKPCHGHILAKYADSM